MANCVHLLQDRYQSFASANRVLREGGWLAINTAFSTSARSAADERLYRELVFLAMLKLKKRVPGMRPSRERPGLANWLDQDELTGALEDIGFGSIRTFIYQASLDVDAVACVVGSSYFARAVFPGVPPDRVCLLDKYEYLLI